MKKRKTKIFVFKVIVLIILLLSTRYTLLLAKENDNTLLNYFESSSSRESKHNTGEKNNIDFSCCPVIVTGGKEHLVPLTFTSYLNGRPFVIFADQQNPLHLLKLISNKYSGHQLQLLLANETFDNFIIELLRNTYLSDSASSADFSQELILTQFNNRHDMNIILKESGIYYVYLKNIHSSAYGQAFRIRIDKQEFEKRNVPYKKWGNLGEIKLTRGKHNIVIRDIYNRPDTDSEIRYPGVEVLLITKKKMDEYRNIISDRPAGHLFYLDNGKKAGELKLKEMKPFSIQKKQFYIAKDGNYSLRGILKPRRRYLKTDIVFRSLNTDMKTSLEAVTGWDVKTLNNTHYQQFFSEEGIHFQMYFKGFPDTEEGILLTKKFSQIKIKDNPYFQLSCNIEDTNSQEIEINFELINKNENHFFSRAKKISVHVNSKNYLINLYEKAEKLFGKEAEDLFINKVVMKFKKMDNINITDEKNRQSYSFMFKNISFLAKQPFFAQMNDELSGYIPGRFYYFNKKSVLKNADIEDRIPPSVENVYKSYTQNFINLNENPELSLDLINMPPPGTIYNRMINFPDEWPLEMGIDIDGDAEVDGVVNVLSSFISQSNHKLLLVVNALESAKKRFPGEKIYNLLFIAMKNPHNNKAFQQDVTTKILFRYVKYIYRHSEFLSDAKVLKIDNKVYNLPSSFSENPADNINNRVEYNNIFLKKGYHSLDFPKNSTFYVEMLEIQPEAAGLRPELIKSSQPVIGVNKINPTRYLLKVNDTKGTFTLVFAESFNKRWKAYIRKPKAGDQGTDTIRINEPWSALWSIWKDRGRRFEIQDHFVVNGYANGWIIPVKQKTDTGQNLQIVLEFVPQRLFEAGLIVSAITLLGSIGYLVAGSRKQRKKGDDKD